MARTFELNDDTVVVVIGSGAGGGTVANELAQKGVNVVCLEAGPLIPTTEITNDLVAMFGRLTWREPRIGAGSLPPAFPVWSGRGVGGTTLHWTASSYRFQPHEFKPVTTYGKLDGTSTIDWPIAYEELAPYYDRAEIKMRVSGTHDMPPLPGANKYFVLAEGARRVGYRRVSTGNLAINSKDADDRPACQQMGFCITGCAIDAKWTSANSEIRKALATEHFELRPELFATCINHDARGRISGVLYRDKSGATREQKARLVCCAANTIDTPRLLLVSTSNQFPNGLGNSSGQVGRNYMRHMSVGFPALMPKPVNFHRGAVQGGVIMDESDHQPARGFAGGYLIQLSNQTPVAAANTVVPGGWGRDYAQSLAQFDHLVAVFIVGEDPAVESNSVTLHPERKDSNGLPVPVVRYDYHPNSVAMRQHAIDRTAAIYELLGATKVFRPPPGVGSSTHNMGTCRMAASARDGVCNKWGQSHDIPNLFVSDGSQFCSSGAENPTLTIVALAIRQAEYITEQLRTRSL